MAILAPSQGRPSLAPRPRRFFAPLVALFCILLASVLYQSAPDRHLGRALIPRLRLTREGPLVIRIHDFRPLRQFQNEPSSPEDEAVRVRASLTLEVCALLLGSAGLGWG